MSMNDYLVKTLLYRGVEINVYQDIDAESPDSWGNDDMFIVYDHRDFQVDRKGFDPQEIFDDYYTQGKSLYDGYWIFPVYAYIHSGVSLSVSKAIYHQVPGYHDWDISFRGFALVKRMKGWSYRYDAAYKRAESLIEEWNMYLHGDVYGFDCEYHSCWGYYGHEDGFKYMIDEAKAAIDYALDKQRKSHLAMLKTWIKNRVPLYARTAFMIPNKLPELITYEA